MRYKSLSKDENDLLTDEQKRELVKLDNEQKNSHRRWYRLGAKLPFKDDLDHPNPQAEAGELLPGKSSDPKTIKMSEVRTFDNIHHFSVNPFAYDDGDELGGVRELNFERGA